MASRTRTGRHLGRRDGPVFISYRQSDGTWIANFVETFLRCGGIIPWRDLADLPAGDVARSVREAMEDGISAGILIVTPELAHSDFVRRYEVPHLQRMLRNDPRRFRLYVINTIRDSADGRSGFDVDAPDRLLGLTSDARTSQRRRRVEKGLLTRDRAENHLLRNAKQYGLLAGTSDAPAVSELPMLLRDLLRHRLRARHPQLLDQEVNIAVQTRPVPNSDEASRAARRDADLTIRLRQNPENHLPAELDYRCLQMTLPIIIDAVHNRGITKVSFSGGCHPSVAWVLGTALPDARGLKEFSWLDAYETGKVWRSLPSSVQLRSSLSLEIDKSDSVKIPPDRIPSEDEIRDLFKGKDTGRGIVVLLSTGLHDLAPVADLAERLGGAPTVVLNVTGPRNSAGRSWVPPDEGEKLARMLGAVIRLVSRLGPVHLGISGSAPLAALTARHCNTVSVHLHEFAQYDDGRRSEYVPVCTTAPGGAFPLTRVAGQGGGCGDLNRLVNLTPHDVTLYRDDEVVHVWEAPEQGQDWVRRSDRLVPQDPLRVDGLDVPHTHLEPGPLTGIPDDEEGTGFIVSRISAAAARRSDFFFPVDEVRDERGTLRGCRGLGSFPAVSDEARPYLQWLPGEEETTR